MTDRPRKLNQVPKRALEAIIDRMTYGYYKLEKNGEDADYLRRIETHDAEYWKKHAKFHMDEIMKGERTTGSGDSHAIALACDAMLLEERQMFEDDQRKAKEMQDKIPGGKDD